MKYQQKSFTVPASGNGTCDDETGHMEPDRRGKCLRCGAQIESPTLQPTTAEHDMSAD